MGTSPWSRMQDALHRRRRRALAPRHSHGRGSDMSPTRKLLHVAVLLGTGFLLLGVPLRADEVDRRKLFTRCIKSCTGVMTAAGPASGWVVNVEKRWVLTCQHVIGTREEVEVVFPVWKDSRLL